MAKKHVTMTNLQLVAMGTAHLDMGVTNPQIRYCTSIGHNKEVAAFNKDRFHLTLHISQSGPFFAFLRTVGQLAFMCSTEPQALQPPPNQVRTPLTKIVRLQNYMLGPYLWGRVHEGCQDMTAKGDQSRHR